MINQQMKNFKDLSVWKKARQNVLSIYKVSKGFPKEERYCLTGQLRRAAISVPANLAEGCGKSSDKDFGRYVQNSFGSSQEIEYLIFLAFELGYISLAEFKTLDQNINEVKAMLLGLLKTLRS